MLLNGFYSDVMGHLIKKFWYLSDFIPYGYNNFQTIARNIENFTFNLFIRIYADVLLHRVRFQFIFLYIAVLEIV